MMAQPMPPRHLLVQTSDNKTRVLPQDQFPSWVFGFQEALTFPCEDQGYVTGLDPCKSSPSSCSEIQEVCPCVGPAASVSLCQYCSFPCI